MGHYDPQASNFGPMKNNFGGGGGGGGGRNFGGYLDLVKTHQHRSILTLTLCVDCFSVFQVDMAVDQTMAVAMAVLDDFKFLRGKLL